MEQPKIYAWQFDSSQWRDYKYDKTTSNAEKEEIEEEEEEEEEVEEEEYLNTRNRILE